MINKLKVPTREDYLSHLHLLTDPSGVDLVCDNILSQALLNIVLDNYQYRDMKDSGVLFYVLDLYVNDRHRIT
jgi:hypothetical protein